MPKLARRQLFQGIAGVLLGRVAATESAIGHAVVSESNKQWIMAAAWDADAVHGWIVTQLRR